nr:PHD finger protein ALFIN-LIKE 4-like [Tanacetum cinerariifolium]
MDASQPYNPRTVEEVFRDFKSRRTGIIKALTTDVEDFYQQCDPGGSGRQTTEDIGRTRHGCKRNTLPRQAYEPITIVTHRSLSSHAMDSGNERSGGIERASISHLNAVAILAPEDVFTSLGMIIIFYALTQLFSYQAFCHEPNSEGSGSAWKAYINARVAGLFLLVLLEYPNRSGSAWKAYMNARVAGLFLLVLLEYPNATFLVVVHPVTSKIPSDSALPKVLEKVHASFVESVPFRNIVIFTIIQIVYFLLCFAKYEEIASSPSRAPSFNLREVNNAIRGNDEGEVSICSKS